MRNRYDRKTLGRVTGYAGAEIRIVFAKDVPSLVTFAGYESPSDDREVTTGKSGSRRIVPTKLFAVDSARLRDGEHLLPSLSRV